MMDNDAKALQLLEKAVQKAKSSLETELSFKPFLMLLDINGDIKTIKNSAYTSKESYALLEDSLTSRVKQDDMQIAILTTDDTMPTRYTDGKVVPAMRLHIEEKSQLDKKISARFIYVPYSLHRTENSDDIYVNLGTPIPVGFPSEYIKKT